MPIKPTPPPFEVKPKPAPKKKPAPTGSKENPPAPAKGTPAKKVPKPEATRRRRGDVPTPKVIPAPKEMETPLPRGRKVTAGPFNDERASRSYESWTVVTRSGDVVEYHRFRSEDDARAFAEAVGR